MKYINCLRIYIILKKKKKLIILNIKLFIFSFYSIAYYQKVQPTKYSKLKRVTIFYNLK